MLAAAMGSGHWQYAEAERIDREVLGVKRRVLGEEHPETLTSAANLASSLSGQGKHAEAERIDREVLGTIERRTRTRRGASGDADGCSQSGNVAPETREARGGGADRPGGAWCEEAGTPSPSQR
jgi:hypothetical protein